MRALLGVAAASVAIALVGCESVIGVEEHPLADDLNYFIGDTWKGTITTTTTTCPPLDTSSTPFELTFIQQGSSAFSYVNEDGCTIDFVASGDTATIRDSGVTCDTKTDGGTGIITILSYTLTSANGLGLTGKLEYTYTAGGETCTYGTALALTR